MNATASGGQSHAEGNNTKASGDSSHAEGYNTSATTYESHAEGYSTLASGYASHSEGNSTKANGYASHAEGDNTIASGSSSHAEGYYAKANGYASHAEGYMTSATTNYSHAEGYYTITLNDSEHASGQYNVSNSASTAFGHSGNTLFSVGNGTYSEGHNAFEIRQNGDIYITSGGTDILLQESLGGTVDQVIDSGTSASTNAVSTSAVYEVIRDNEYVVSQALNDLESRKLDASAYTPTDLSNYYTKSETSGATEISNALGAKVNTSDIVSAITPSNSGSTEPIATKVVAENELVMANALNDLDERKLDASAYTTTSAVTSGSTDAITSGGVYAQLDGIKIKKITQSAYDALVQAGTVDANTLYVITD